MKMSIGVPEIRNRLLADSYADWTFRGATALAKYYEEYYPDEELDVTAIRCQWNEYESLTDFMESHFADLDAAIKEIGSDKEFHIREWVEQRAALIEFDGGVIVEEF